LGNLPTKGDNSKNLYIPYRPIIGHHGESSRQRR
jgi:hypothetical protein